MRFLADHTGRIFSFEEITRKPHEIWAQEPHANTREALMLLHAWFNQQAEFVFHTTGTTGTPKAFSFSRQAMMASARASLNALDIEGGHFLNVLDTKRIASVMAIIRAVLANADITLHLPSSDPLSEINSNHLFTNVSFVPMQIQGKLNDENKQKLLRFKRILLGGAAISESLEQEIGNFHPGMYHTYGMTETLSHFALRHIGYEKYFTALPGSSIRINDQQLLEVRSEVTKNHWFTTSDMAQRINEEQFIILGRGDDIINSGGHKIVASLVEKAFEEALKSFACLCLLHGLPDDVLGQKATLFIFAPDSTHIHEIKSRIHELIAQKNLPIHRFDFPKEVYFVKEICYNSGGKPDKQRTSEVQNRII